MNRRRILVLATAALTLAVAPAGASTLVGIERAPQSDGDRLVDVDRAPDPSTWACAGVHGVAAVCVENPFDSLPDGSIFDWLP